MQTVEVQVQVQDQSLSIMLNTNLLVGCLVSCMLLASKRGQVGLEYSYTIY